VLLQGDHEFKACQEALANIGIMDNTTSRNEHVPEIERYNQTIKDWVSSAFNMLPFKKCQG
jgi:hypothetical protein